MIWACLLAYHGMSTQNDFSLGLTRSCFDSPPFCGLLTGLQVSGGTLVEGTTGVLSQSQRFFQITQNDFSKSQSQWFFEITQNDLSDLNDYSYCSITDAAQVQCGRGTMAANELHFTWPSTCHVLDKYSSVTWKVPVRYLQGTCQVLAEFLSGTCQVPSSNLPGTCQLLGRYLLATCKVLDMS